MKFSLIACAVVLAGFAAAQEEKQSKPFKLVLSADDKSLNGQHLTACHTGAAIESLCLIGGQGSNFHFNTSDGSTAPFKDFTPTGELTFNLPFGNYFSPHYLLAPYLTWRSRRQQAICFGAHALLRRAFDKCGVAPL